MVTPKGHLPALLDGSLCLTLEQLESDNANSHQHHTQMDDVATVAPAVPANQGPQCNQVALTFTSMPGKHATPEFVHGNKDYECTQPEPQDGSRIPYAADDDGDNDHNRRD